VSTPADVLNEIVDRNADQLVASLRECLRIPSVEGPAAPNAPYGTECRKALDYTLHLCEALGFTTADFGGHAGHAEFGEGQEMVAALGHLDVVPEGDHAKWTYGPYSAELVDGVIYARGSSDDKGPTYAALFGALAVKQSGLPLKRRIRVIFGCDEESGFGCVHHYFEVAGQERPVYGFTPDSSFPLCYAEKGICDIVLERITEQTGPVFVASVEGGLRSNMVPELCTARLSGPDDALAGIKARADKLWDGNVTALWDGAYLVLKAVGLNAHGSTPYLGDNAVARMARTLMDLGLGSWTEELLKSADTAGSYIGIAGRDDVAGPLTSNLGLISFDGRTLRTTYNIRYPVTWKYDDLMAMCRRVVEPLGWRVAESSNKDPLFVPLDSEPSRTLLAVYQEVTGDLESMPYTMGGGTYARATPHVVAYGMEFPGDIQGPAHEPNECMPTASLIRATKVYAQALYRLANL
jgi:succinyl-diaminopimelate desuccinylase